MSPVGPKRGHIVLLGGIVGIAARPVVQRVREHVRQRVRTAGFGDDPVAPFRQAPCYSPSAEQPNDEREAHATP